MGGLGSLPVIVSLYFLSPKMNLLFNPSYMKVSAGREGPMRLMQFNACVPWGTWSP